MAYEVSCVCYPRPNHYRSRLLSVRPRLNRILENEFGTEHLRQTNEDEKTIEEINSKVRIFSDRERVHVVVMGHKSSRDVISAGSLVLKDDPNTAVIYCNTVKQPSIHVIVVEMDPNQEKQFTTDLHQYLSEIPEQDQKYVVIAIIPQTGSDIAVVRHIARKQTKSLETPGGNFDFDQCVAILPTIEILKQQGVETNKPVTRKAGRKLTEETTRPQSATAKPTSPPKRKFNPQETSQRKDGLATKRDISPRSTETLAAAFGQCEVTSEKSIAELTKVDEKVLSKAISYQLECKAIDLVEEIDDYLKRVKKRRDDFAREVLFTDLDKMVFELRGLFNISVTKKGQLRKEAVKNSRLSDGLSAELHQLAHVKAFGIIYGKLTVHVSAEAEERQKEQTKTAIESAIRRNAYTEPYSVHFIQCKRNQLRGITIHVSIGL